MTMISEWVNVSSGADSSRLSRQSPESHKIVVVVVVQDVVVNMGRYLMACNENRRDVGF